MWYVRAFSGERLPYTGRRWDDPGGALNRFLLQRNSNKVDAHDATGLPRRFTFGRC